MSPIDGSQGFAMILPGICSLEAVVSPWISHICSFLEGFVNPFLERIILQFGCGSNGSDPGRDLQNSGCSNWEKHILRVNLWEYHGNMMAIE